jgi:hypothetical protein
MGGARHYRRKPDNERDERDRTIRKLAAANVSSKFDMTGLPEPLVYALYFSAHGDRIVQLIILRSHTTFESGRSIVAGALGY